MIESWRKLRRIERPGRGWKSRNMVDRYAKLATENLALSASRIESTREDDTGESDNSLI
jgi:hypothetical protein